MAFHQAFPAALSPAEGRFVPSGETVSTWTIYQAIRDVAAKIGLGPKVHQTLAVMIGFLKPGKGMICFASTKEILRRASCSESTLRRHVVELQRVGILLRRDSPNHKRYANHNRSTGDWEAYGFDLSPMIENASRWLQLLEEQEAEEMKRKFLRTQVFARLAWLDAQDLDNPGVETAELRKIIRRKLTIETLERLVAELDAELGKAEATSLPCQGEVMSSEPSPAFPAEEVDVSGSQNERHHSKSKTEEQDLKKPNRYADLQDDERKLLRKMEAGCSEALQLSPVPMRNWPEIERHAEMLAPMLGIDRSLVTAAKAKMGTKKTAISIFLMVQMHHRVRNMQAYFRSLVTGRRANSFDPLALLDRLSCAKPDPQ